MAFHLDNEFPPSAHHALYGLSIQEIDATELAHVNGGRYLVVYHDGRGNMLHRVDPDVRSEFFHSLGD
jgi:hypothetical protein